MIDKFNLYVDEQVLAVKFNTDGNRIIVGGYNRFQRTIETVVVEYFNLEVPKEPSYTQKNKIRYTLQCSREMFYKGIDKLKEHGYVLQRVKSHRRIMR